MTRGRQQTYWSSCLDLYLRHPDVGLVEVLDCLGGVLGSLVTDIANSALGDELDVGDLAVLGGEVRPDFGFSNTWGQPFDKYP